MASIAEMISFGNFLNEGMQPFNYHGQHSQPRSSCVPVRLPVSFHDERRHVPQHGDGHLPSGYPRPVRFSCAYAIKQSYASASSISSLSLRTMYNGTSVIRATLSTESPSKSMFFAISSCFMNTYIALSMDFISSVIRYLELKLLNFTSSCNTLNIGSEMYPLKSASRLSVSMARSHCARRLCSAANDSTCLKNLLTSIIVMASWS